MNMKVVVETIDRVNSTTGSLIRWLAVGMILATAYEVVARYLFNAPTVWAHQSVMIMGGMLVCLSWGWVHLRRSHVSMDIIYRRLSPRTQAMLDVGGALLFLFPLLVLLIYVSGEWMTDSWMTGEKWVVSIWKPPLAPSRTVILVGFALFLLQGVATFIRDVHFIVKGKRL